MPSDLPIATWRPQRRWWLRFIFGCVALALLCRLGDWEQKRDDVAWSRYQQLHSLLWNVWGERTDRARTRFAPGLTLGEPRRIGRITRLEVPGAQIDPKYQGWVVVIRFARDPNDAQWEGVVAGRVVPPTGVAIRKISPIYRVVSIMRATVMITSLIAWLAGISIIIMAGGARHQIASFCIAAGVAVALSAYLGPEFHWRSIAEFHGSWFDAGRAMTLVALFPWMISSRRANPRICSICRYNLTANISGICPECGTPTIEGIRRELRAELAPVAERLVHLVDCDPIESESLRGIA